MTQDSVHRKFAYFLHTCILFLMREGKKNYKIKFLSLPQTIFLPLAIFRLLQSH